MDSFGEDDEDIQFFDARDEIDLESDDELDCGLKGWEYDVWIRTPMSVGERRREFIGMMGLSTPELGAKFVEKVVGNGNNEAVLRESSDGVEFDSLLSCDVDDRINSCEFNLSECRKDQGIGDIGSMKLGHILFAEKFESRSKKIEERAAVLDSSSPLKLGKSKQRWLSKLNSFTCITCSNTTGDDMVMNSLGKSRPRRVKVRHSRKKLKELSALFIVQDIQSHEGSILTMKFSPDGQYLASGGEDTIVRVWQVVEDVRSSRTVEIPDADPSCVYFSANHLSELEPLMVEKDKVDYTKSLQKTLDSACVVFPPKVFHIFETPLHVFKGHTGDVLDLSWSKDNRLLSASIDKTVRLWRVGVDRCLKVFKHSDYVTCLQFNPIDGDCFVSGSIDGKVRIWTIGCGQVVRWAEMRDIITAVSYRPDGQSGIVGTITGACRCFNISDDNLELETEMCWSNKKKSSCKRITGFQFFPQDPSKVLVTSADSQLRILHGTNVIWKYKGLRKVGNSISATPTSDGKHIVSACDDSAVYVWNVNDPLFSHGKVIKSFEYFASESSVAIPWPGMKPGGMLDVDVRIDALRFWSSTRFSLTHEYLLDSGSKVSATWPEEKLPASSGTSPMSKAQYKLFKTSYDSSSRSHAWGLVIVAARWDGRIRVYRNYGLPVSV
ncbi:uncharacterized protein LOC127256225 [Andrographis paniculata]|uniref:uncharacterized protein LOC127256225 n=1 Tax=Andrographis paniculata TaxID=175694 RepID=UPI0021E74317|nr:uncharacterized protein LOC127256225 [Andrographis paniculata]